VKGSGGFTLIEMMIAAAIIAILALIAVPSYQAYIVRANEGVAKAFLAELASRQQAFYNDRRSFAEDLADLGYATETVGLRGDGQIAADGDPLIYTVSVEEDSVTARAYVVIAVPQATQAARSQCGTLRWTAQGTRSASGPKGDACWQR
jgi:type IV pilus assembly protein PilE